MDWYSGLDYADQGMYAGTLGTFNPADSYRPSAGATDRSGELEPVFLNTRRSGQLHRPSGLAACRHCRSTKPTGNQGEMQVNYFAALFTLLFTVGAISLSLGASAQGLPVYHPAVCQIFEDIERWNGLMVELPVEIDGRKGFEGEAWISGKECPTKLEWNGISFENTLALQYPMNKHLILHNVEFSWDDESFQDWYQLLASFPPGPYVVHARLLGMIETRVPPSTLVIKNVQHPQGLRSGFGHLGGHPGQVIVEKLSAITVVRPE